MKKGFTLIELLVVIAIIALLASVVVSSLQTARKKGRDGVRVQDIQQINTAINMYISDHGHAPYLENDFCEPSVGDSSCSITEFSKQFGGSDGDDWLILQTQLAPYIAKLAKDPCGAACHVEGEAEAGFYAYHYTAPGAWGAGSATDYQIYAQNLEMKPGPFGFNTLYGGSY